MAKNINIENINMKRIVEIIEASPQITSREILIKYGFIENEYRGNIGIFTTLKLTPLVNVGLLSEHLDEKYGRKTFTLNSFVNKNNLNTINTKNENSKTIKKNQCEFRDTYQFCILNFLYINGNSVCVNNKSFKDYYNKNCKGVWIEGSIRAQLDSLVKKGFCEKGMPSCWKITQKGKLKVESNITNESNITKIENKNESKKVKLIIVDERLKEKIGKYGIDIEKMEDYIINHINNKIKLFTQKEREKIKNEIVTKQNELDDLLHKINEV